MAIFRGTGGQGDSTTDTTVTTVTEKAAEAASSATSAANSATSASNSATSAETSATNAATSESNAATSATNASTSATSAETAKTAAQAAQTAAETAETNAETAEANAVTAKNQAVSAKDNAVIAQTAAETAETNAETAYANTLAIFGDAQDVQDAVDSASTSETNAALYATSALTSATNAANSATSAGTSETNAASSASSAATSAASANSYATDAQTAQTAAETAQAAAEAAEYNINGLYLGSLADDPTLDGNGVAVTTGDLYFNTTAQEVRVYTDGDVWEPVVDLGGDITVNSLTSNNDVVVKGNLEVQGTTITVDSATAQTIDLGDNDRIRLGDSDDLQVYHDGTDSYIANSTGTLKLSGNTDVTGNITVSGTVDGRDVAADGTKLDGIEASADVTDTANVTAAGALMDSEVTNLAQVKAFNSADYATAAQGATADSALQTSGGTLTGDLAFGDNVKAKFGASDDLQIYHSGSSSFISDASGAGFINIRSNAVRLASADGLEILSDFVQNGGVTLYHNNSSKLSTTSSGVDVTGTLVSDGLTVDGSAQVRSVIPYYFLIETDSTDLNTGLRGADGQFQIRTFGDNLSTSTTRFALNHSSGDISFYEDTGTTAKLTWDASTEELQFKDNVKAEFGDGGDLELYSDGTNGIIKSSATQEYRAVTHSFESTTGGTTRAVIDSTGIDVTGTVTADGLTVDGDVLLDKTATGANKVLINASSGNNSRLVFCEGANAGEKYNIGFLSSDASFNVYHSAGSANRLKLQNNGDISFYDNAGTSQDFYWDASTSRLGLGTTTPSAPLTVDTSAGTFTVDVSGGSSNEIASTGALILKSGQFQTQINQSNGTAIARFMAGTGDVLFYNDSGSSQDLYWDASTSRLGLGTTSPARNLVVNSGSNSGFISIVSSSTQDVGLLLGDSDSDAVCQLKYLNSSNALVINTNGSEAARIDSSGNLLVGTTDSTLYNNTSGEGVGLIGGDHIEVATSGGSALFLNRMTSDGNIAGFFKDGGSIGNIGVDNTDNIFLSGNSSHSGLMVGTESIVPYANGNTSDATEDLGASSIRWRNLYLSGGVYLGGTGSANLLDDYEEGVFTANLRCGGTTLMTSTSCKYTKIGIFVFYAIDFASSTYSGVGANTGNVDISGLPFTSSGNGRIINGSPSLAGGVFTVNLNTIQTSILNSTSILSCNKINATGISNVTEADLSASSSSLTFLRVSGSYQTF